LIKEEEEEEAAKWPIFPPNHFVFVGLVWWPGPFKAHNSPLLNLLLAQVGSVLSYYLTHVVRSIVVKGHIYHIESKKKCELLCGRNPKAKSPKGESHEELSVSPIATRLPANDRCGFHRSSFHFPKLKGSVCQFNEFWINPLFFIIIKS
jgi:hypothetical protein